MDRDIEQQGNIVTRQPQGRTARRPMAANTADRRSWLSQGFAALSISALGLAIAGSMSLTTSAQTTVGGDAPAVAASATPGSGTGDTGSTATAGTGGSASTVGVSATGGLAGTAQAATGGDTVDASQPAVAQAFLARDPGVDTSRSEQLRAALAKERAAQRAENLARDAEQVTRAVRDAASKARKSTLDATEKQIQDNAIKIALQRQQAAIAARVAAGTAVANAAAADSTTASDPDPSTIPTGGTAVSPVPGAVIGARFGEYGLWARYHTGLDFRAAYGTPIRSVLPGVVVYAGNSGDWAGNHVAIRQAGGMTTMYSHMSRMAAHAGETVAAGQIIGYVGQTGRAFGPHLHFELYPAGVKYGDVYKAIDPLPWLHAHGLQTH